MKTTQLLKPYHLFATVVTIAITVPALEVFALPSRFLPNAQPGVTPDINNLSTFIHSYGQMMPTMFDQNVQSSVGQCGTIKFDYNTYSDNPGGNVSGGAALAGGFFLDSRRCMVLDGFQLHWVQTVIATETAAGVADWMLPPMNAGWFPDAPPEDPTYSGEGLLPGVNPPNPPGNPTVAFSDLPNRSFAGGNESVLFELGLVAISNTANIEMMGMMFKEVRVIDTFLWGFDINSVAPFDVQDVVAFPPISWGDPTATFLNTLNEFYDGMGGGDPNATPPNSMPPKKSEKFKFFNNDMAFKLLPRNRIPEPTSPLSLLALGTLGAASTLKRKLKPSQSTEKETTKVG